MTFSLIGRLTAVIATLALIAGCDDAPSSEHGHGGGEAAAEQEYERGPHRGRMLRDGDFALEITIFEDGVDPEFHVYAYRSEEPVAPSDVDLEIELHRLGGKVDRFEFAPHEDYLRGDGVVTEPHSFDVRVRASEGTQEHEWTYQSYEGRTIISEEAARAGGIETEIAGPATVGHLVDLAGRVEIVPEGRSEIRGQYPGRIVEMRGALGQTVNKGQVLARIEASHSLREYSVHAPMDGVIVAKGANAGDVTGDRPMFVVADPTRLHAEFFVYPGDAERIRAGQTVEVRNFANDTRTSGEVELVLPVADVNSQSLVAHVALPPSAAESFRPGMSVEGSFEVAAEEVPLAVRTKALQRFRDFTVVYAKVDETYEVRMLELGRRTPEWTEVLGGLEPGTEYVTDGAFLIRADVEKSGASHDH
ncbi:MAG: HlyD family secretion protein [Parvibaculum sp.]|uniref:efflux RND transporter periplasmic adaptor subunit n=1 Tax=Parvibaculum sp. TaxID=2024848 RepID=UPI000C5DD305|nr:HlyD family efflux transporter periplasmic adaptor subunit [Parvibaculum sp.]MAU60195.1 HlyD family secretion protein [Parvibaculum sp.]|tara:strand:+ start:355 stop:1611 length:1257 start_codon:yes stop_codon:yes gene_type:complete